MQSQARTVSEALFEDYLERNEYPLTAYEPSIPGQGTKPDYRIDWQDIPTYHEVKELKAREWDSRPCHFDPYKSLRLKINEAQRKFKKTKDCPCTLVVHDLGDWTARLGPFPVFGAMLGNLGFRMPFDPAKGEADIEAITSTFLEGGKMIAPSRKRYQNQTTSAIVVLGVGHYEHPDFAKDRDRRLLDAHWNKGRPLTYSESWGVVAEFGDKYPRACFLEPRVVVVENPVARIPLPRDLLAGPYDERWAIHNGKTACIFEGELLKEQRRIIEEARRVVDKIHA